MRQVFGLLLSVLLHGGLIASALIAFPQASRFGEELVIVPVELVTLAEQTNVRAARPEPEPEPEEPLEEQEPEPLTNPEPVADPEPEIIPPAPEPEIAEAPEPAPAQPEDAPEPEPEPTPPPQPRERPQPQGLDLNSLSRLVDRSREDAAAAGAEAGATRSAAGGGTAMTATLQAMAASQIARCVRSNADAPADMDLRVIVEVRLERDGALAGAPRLLDEGRVLNSPNPFLRVAGERALRAVIDCAPYRLPPENYQQWRLLEVNVDTQTGR